MPPDGAWQGVYTLLAADGTPVPVFASHTAVATRQVRGAAAGPGEAADAASSTRRREARPARVAAESDPLGLRDDALLRLAVDDYLPLATERVRDALDADASYLLIAPRRRGRVRGGRGQRPAGRGARDPDGGRRPRRARRADAHLPVVIADGAGTDGRAAARHAGPVAGHGSGGRRRAGDRRAGGGLGARRRLQRRPVRAAATARPTRSRWPPTGRGCRPPSGSVAAG